MRASSNKKNNSKNVVQSTDFAVTQDQMMQRMEELRDQNLCILWLTRLR